MDHSRNHDRALILQLGLMLDYRDQIRTRAERARQLGVEHVMVLVLDLEDRRAAAIARDAGMPGIDRNIARARVLGTHPVFVSGGSIGAGLQLLGRHAPEVVSLIEAEVPDGAISVVASVTAGGASVVPLMELDAVLADAAGAIGPALPYLLMEDGPQCN